MIDVPLYRPDATCPKCGKPPRLGIPREQLAKWTHDHPTVVVQTYQCAFEARPGRKCDEIYPIRAGDMQRARLIKRRAKAHMRG